MTDKFLTEVKLCDKDGTSQGKIGDAQVTKITWKRNADDEAEIAFHPLLDDALLFKTAEQETQIWINGELRWWGINEGLTGDSKGLVAKLPGLCTYLANRWILEDVTYGPYEQMAIGVDLITYAQDAIQGTNPDLNIAIGTPPDLTGVDRQITFKADDAPNILEALRQFPTYDDGFEWQIEYTNDGSRFWTPYILLGSDRPIFLEYGREIIDYEWEEVGDPITRLRMTGGNPVSDTGTDTGLAKIYGEYEDTVASTRYGVRMQIVAGSNEATVDDLTAQAQLGVALKKDPYIITSVTVKNTKFDIFEQAVLLGDALRFRIDHGRVQVNTTSRIDTIEWDPKLTKFSFIQEGS